LLLPIISLSLNDRLFYRRLSGGVWLGKVPDIFQPQKPGTNIGEQSPKLTNDDKMIVPNTRWPTGAPVLGLKL
jgi:hypothetical protein